MNLLNLIKVDVIWIILGIILLLVYFKLKNKKIKKAIFNFNISIYKPFITILIPFFLSIIVFILFTLITKKFGYDLVGYDIPLLYSIFSSVVIAPFFEELVLRGMILGSFLYFSEEIVSKSLRIIFISAGFILQLFLFVLAHQRTHPLEISFLIINGLVYSLLFIFYKRNLLPPVIAHLTNNLLIALHGSGLL